MLTPKRAYYNENVRCYSNGRIERIDKRFKNPVWREVAQTTFTEGGYLQVKTDRKTEYWHRVIWIAFNGEIPDKLTINHKDEIKTNNALSNLELLTRGDNTRYGTRTKRSAEKQSKPVVGVNIETGEKVEFPSIREAERNGFNSGAVVSCCKGKRKSHKGYKWCYA